MVPQTRYYIRDENTGMYLQSSIKGVGWVDDIRAAGFALDKESADALCFQLGYKYPRVKVIKVEVAAGEQPEQPNLSGEQVSPD